MGIEPENPGTMAMAPPRPKYVKVGRRVLYRLENIKAVEE
jgi:hypothetical protein